MCQRIYRNVQRQLLPIVRADAFSFIASVVCAERAAKAVLAHDRHKIALIKKTFELDVAIFVQAFDSIDFVK